MSKDYEYENKSKIIMPDSSAGSPMVPAMSQEKYAEITRAMIMSENQLIHYRVSWLMTIQGLLFAALGFSWDKAQAKHLIIIFALVGVSVSISILFLDFPTMCQKN